MKRADMRYQRSSLPVKRKKHRYVRSRLGFFGNVGEYDTNKLQKNFADTTHYPMLRSTKRAELIQGLTFESVCDALISDGVLYALCYEHEMLFICATDLSTKEKLFTVEVRNGMLLEGAKYSLVRYNVFSSVTDPIKGKYQKRLLILPEYISIDIDGSEGYSPVFHAGVPEAEVGCVFMSRIFCARGGKLFASNFNDVGTYTFDTADESLESNAWMTNTQSNTRGDGEITALCVYDGHVVVFKKDYMMQVYNNKNPFRIVEIGDFGCISQGAVCNFDGKLAFVGENGPMLYSGGYPYSIGHELNVSDWSGSIVTSCGKLLFIYAPKSECIYVYDAVNNCWSQRDVVGIGHMFSDGNAAYFIQDTAVYKLESGEYGAINIATDKSSLGYNQVKHIYSVEAEIVLGEQSKVSVCILDEAGAYHSVAFVSSPGKHFINRRLYRRKMKYVQLVFIGEGDVMIGDVAITFRTEEGSV